MTTQEFATNLDSLIANAKREGLADGEVVVLLREATDAVLDKLIQYRTVDRPTLCPGRRTNGNAF
jgi:hypothetical protein